MPNKNNPFLAKRDAQKEAEHKQRLRALSEVHIIAMLIAAHRALKVGPGRAYLFLEEYVSVKMQIAKDIQEDIGDSHRKRGSGDREFLYTKHDLAATLKQIFGKEKWKLYRDFFPMLRDFWED